MTMTKIEMRGRKHGYRYTSEYEIWSGMIKRCRNKKHGRYADYGGRGIKVCQRWRLSVVNFIDDMGMRPSEKHTLERIDNDGDYKPSNCRWATYKEQANNTRRNRYLTVGGVTKLLAVWAAEVGVDTHLISDRLRLGWAPTAAVYAPVQNKGRRKKVQHK